LKWHQRIRNYEVTMQRAVLLFSAVALAAAPLAAQTPAAGATRPRAAIAPGGDSARFATIRGRFRHELDNERAALRRTHDRMREELVAAGWRPRMRPREMRVRMAGFRGRLRDRMSMRHGARLERGPVVMRRGPTMMRRDGGAAMGRGGSPMMGRRDMVRGQRPGRPGAMGNDSTRAMRRRARG
jgi:hypothetical protein